MDKKKRKTECDDNVSIIKKRRKSITLQLKLDIIERYDKGEKKADIARSFGLNEATIRTILKQSDGYKKKGKSASSSTAMQMQSTRNRSEKMIEMERLLLVWIEDCNQKRVPLSTHSIKTKALSLFSTLKGDGEIMGEKSFIGSSGWFERFKKRARLHSVRIQEGDSSVSSTGADHQESAKKLIIEFQKLADDERYDDRQIFNNNNNNNNNNKIDNETALYWKRVPTKKTFLAKKEESRTTSDSKVETGDTNAPKSEMTLQQFQRIFRTSEVLKQQLINVDPDLERSSQVRRMIDSALSCYREAFEEKTQKCAQTTLDTFFSTKKKLI